jgi:hypothetical protein
LVVEESEDELAAPLDDEEPQPAMAEAASNGMRTSPAARRTVRGAFPPENFSMGTSRISPMPG